MIPQYLRGASALVQAARDSLAQAGDDDLAARAGRLLRAISVRADRAILDAETRAAGFDGYDGCPDDHCPTPWRCSERGDCELEPTPEFDGSACGYWRRVAGVPGYAEEICSFGCIDEPACLTGAWGPWPGEHALAVEIVGRLLG